MPHKEYYDPKKPPLYIAKIDPVVKEDWLDICYFLDQYQPEAFKVVVNEFKAKHKIKPRPSRKKT